MLLLQAIFSCVPLPDIAQEEIIFYFFSVRSPFFHSISVFLKCFQKTFPFLSFHSFHLVSLSLTYFQRVVSTWKYIYSISHLFYMPFTWGSAYIFSLGSQASNHIKHTKQFIYTTFLGVRWNFRRYTRTHLCSWLITKPVQSIEISFSGSTKALKKGREMLADLLPWIQAPNYHDELQHRNTEMPGAGCTLSGYLNNRKDQQQTHL